jgi:hypothetical protein
MRHHNLILYLFNEDCRQPISTSGHKYECIVLHSYQIITVVCLIHILMPCISLKAYMKLIWTLHTSDPTSIHEPYKDKILCQSNRSKILGDQTYVAIDNSCIKKNMLFTWWAKLAHVCLLDQKYVRLNYDVSCQYSKNMESPAINWITTIILHSRLLIFLIFKF